MIQFVTNRDIDKKKWDQLVIEQGNARMYILSAYLDSVCHDWSALIYNDYQAIMPLPIKRSWFGYLRHDIPLFVQQLGIVGIAETEIDIRNIFIETATKHFRKFIHVFNHENGFIELDGYESKMRPNFEIDLNRTYDELRNDYSVNLNRNLKKASNMDFKFQKKSEISLLRKFISDYSNPEDPSPKNIATIERITEIGHPEFSPNIYSVWNSGVPMASCLAPKFKKRITLLVPRSSSEGKKLNAMAFLIDRLIQDYSNSDFILDFEGSMISGVAKFYQGFGARNKPYVILTKS